MPLRYLLRTISVYIGVAIQIADVIASISSNYSGVEQPTCVVHRHRIPTAVSSTQHVPVQHRVTAEFSGQVQVEAGECDRQRERWQRESGRMVRWRERGRRGVKMAGRRLGGVAHSTSKGKGEKEKKGKTQPTQQRAWCMVIGTTEVQ